jgi:hypothetical protein
LRIYAASWAPKSCTEILPSLNPGTS